MAIENEDQAIQALANAGAIDDGTASQSQEPVSPTDDQAQASDQPRIDLSHLDFSNEQAVRGYLEQREREMQGDYTRKTQEVAAQRREAEQALEFINALNSDPNFAYDVTQTLTQALQQQGYSFADAQAIAANQASQGFEEDDAFVDPYMDKINQLEQWAAGQEQRIAVANAEAQINAGINAIRAENPNYTDDDIKDVLTMAFAYGGDVLQAHEAYRNVTQRVTESYLNQKESVPSSLNQPSSAGHAEVPPEGFTSLNDPRLEEAAKRMLNEAGAQW